MTDRVSTEKRSRMMAAVRGADTLPELYVRKKLFAAGFRFRLHAKELVGKPDIVLPRFRMVVFVHGCFWHGHDCARGARVPKANRDYWTAKVARNRARDGVAKGLLEGAGWRVEVVWECALRDREGLEERVRGWLR